MNLLDPFITENTGITESLEQTSWTPLKQAQGKSIIDINITKYDVYDESMNKINFDPFLNSVQTSLKQRKLKEVLMRLFSQFVSVASVEYLIDRAGTLEYIFFGEEDDELVSLGKYLNVYKGLVEKFNANLIDDADKELELTKRPGSLPYLAMTSHGLSHTKFWDEVEKGLRSAFSSGKNFGYNPNK